MQEKLFVGISGLTNLEEVNSVLRIYELNGFNLNSRYNPRLTFLVNDESLKHPNEKRGARFPIVKDLGLMISACQSKAIPVVGFNARQINYLYDSVKKIMECSPGLKDLQLQVIAPEKDEKHIEQVSRIRGKFGNLRIHLNFGKGALNPNPEILGRHFENYSSFGISGVMFDYSSGKGNCLPASQSIDVYRKFSKKYPGLAISFAGGLNPETLESCLSPIFEEVGKNFGYDSLSGVRNKNSENYGDDSLDIEKVNDYLSESKRIVG